MHTHRGFFMPIFRRMKKLPKSETYEEFVEKFKPKKTTDDCCTPPTIYEIVKQWPATNTGLTPPKLCGHDEEVCKIRGRPENSGR